MSAVRESGESFPEEMSFLLEDEQEFIRGGDLEGDISGVGLPEQRPLWQEGACTEKPEWLEPRGQRGWRAHRAVLRGCASVPGLWGAQRDASRGGTPSH